jgi:hypothetical protein
MCFHICRLTLLGCNRCGHCIRLDLRIELIRGFELLAFQALSSISSKCQDVSCSFAAWQVECDVLSVNSMEAFAVRVLLSDPLCMFFWHTMYAYYVHSA